ncbi:DUF3679 domain-containing protein [Neobacillus sp. YIM B06451]|uniref:DUF3679 domain-containing protein n=1 Tax=Neobacillus sp. YIM B06451 TaxID=3070994 RepID=UPI0029307CF5|nr:DUF3679 domain-containing protein [Neobacillus sp. YIM B06451]
MKLFTLKALGLAAIMFALALGGMQAANGGINRIKGYGDSGYKQPVSFERDGREELKVGIMGEEAAIISLDKRARESEESKGFNLFSSMGKALTSVLSGAIKGILEFFSR